MAGYATALLQSDVAEENKEREKDNLKWMGLSLLGGFLLPHIIGPGMLAQQTAASTAGNILAGTAKAGTDITSIVGGLSKVNPNVLKLAQPFTKIGEMAGGGALGQSVSRGLLKNVGSSLAVQLGGLGRDKDKYTFGGDPYKEYSNPFSSTNIASMIDTSNQWYENLLDKQSKQDKLDILNRYL